jgi:outer membrane protein OmpA-like peptidoglycan-associated protein
MLMKLRMLAAIAGAISLTACTTIDPYTGQSKVSNTAAGAGIGAVAGAVGGLIFGGKNSRTAALIGAGVGALAGAGVGAYMDQQEAELRAQLQGTGVSVTRQGDQIILNMPSNVTFDVDQATVKPQFYQTLNSVALVLKKYDRTLVDVYGYTDSTGSAQHNQDLSERRARAVAMLVSSEGVDARRIYVQGFGENDPIATNATEAGRAQNRRVEIQIAPLT